MAQRITISFLDAGGNELASKVIINNRQAFISPLKTALQNAMDEFVALEWKKINILIEP